MFTAGKKQQLHFHVATGLISKNHNVLNLAFTVNKNNFVLTGKDTILVTMAATTLGKVCRSILLFF